MKQRGKIVIGLCFLMLITGAAVKGQNRNERVLRYEDKAAQYEGKVEAYENKVQQYEAKAEEYEDKTQHYEAKAEEYENKARQYQDKNNTHFENFDAGIKNNQYIVSGTAKLVEDDENAILAELNTGKITTITIDGTIEYKKGEADLYLISSNDKMCILSSEEIQKNGEVQKTIDLEEGCNQIIFKGEDCIVEFELVFHSKNMSGLIF